ncbi:MAG: tRNA (adenosine(37)-N6)-threonylcarbamoyltransferase complex dimerization subunit type 1 TsaB [Bdellovibrionales bacterium]
MGKPYNRVLSIDTALEACAVSVANGDDIFTAYEPMGRGQTEKLLPMILDTCDRAGTKLKDIEAVVVTRGPGSFTGVRVGLSVARTLEATQNIPLYGLTTFEAVSLLLGEGNSDYGIVLESKRDDVYFQKKGSAPSVSEIGTVQKEHPNLPLVGNVEGVQTVALDKITEKMIEYVRQNDVEIGGSSPVYLRGADISKSKKSYRSLSDEVLSGLK